MTLTTEIFGSVVVVHAPEELGGEQADSFELCVERVERSNVVLDLDATETLDSSGLNALLNLQDKFHALDGDLKISTANSMNRKILEVTRLDQHFEVFDSVIDAVKAFQV